MNWAVPGFTMSGSGTGPPGVGCMAGDWTLKVAVNTCPLVRIFFPFDVWMVRFDGDRVRVSVPVPGVTNGGAVYGSGPRSAVGSSSPWRHANWLLTCTSVLVPVSGTGAWMAGTSTGGGILIWIMSPVLMMKSLGTS